MNPDEQAITNKPGSLEDFQQTKVYVYCEFCVRLSFPKDGLSVVQSLEQLVASEDIVQSMESVFRRQPDQEALGW